MIIAFMIGIAACVAFVGTVSMFKQLFTKNKNQ